MSTPTKPERVEVGQRYTTKFDPFMVIRYNGETDWAVKYDDGLLIGCPEDDDGAEGETFAGYCEEFEAVPLAAPATPGTATVTPVSRRDCPDCGKGVVFDEDGCCAQCGRDTRLACGDGLCGASDCPDCARKQWPDAASKPPASPVGPPASCLMEQWDGATATPRTALQAIQAKREPEPWVESCDLLHWLRDA